MENKKEIEYKIYYDPKLNVPPESALFQILRDRMVAIFEIGRVDLTTPDDFQSIATNVKALYAWPPHVGDRFKLIHDDRKSDNRKLLTLLSRMARMGIGTVVLTSGGYTWFVTDIDRYRALCQELKVKDSDFLEWPL